MTTPAEALARRFHELYEQLAPAHGYETRKASAVPWEDVPAANKSLMISVAQHLLSDGDDPLLQVPVEWRLHHEPRARHDGDADRHIAPGWWLIATGDTSEPEDIRAEIHIAWAVDADGKLVDGEVADRLHRQLTSTVLVAAGLPR